MNVKEGNIPFIDIKPNNLNEYKHNLFIGLTSKRDLLNELSDDDLFKYYLDVYNHEYLHHVLYNLFGENRILCYLLDVIQQHLRLEFYNDIKHKIYNEHTSKITWDKYIKMFGIKRFFEKYGIEPHHLLRVKELTTKRV